MLPKGWKQQTDFAESAKVELDREGIAFQDKDGLLCELEQALTD